MSLYWRIDINIISIVVLFTVLCIANKKLEKKETINIIFLNASWVILIQLILETLTCIINGRSGISYVYISKILHTGLFVVGTLIGYLWFRFIYLWIYNKKLSLLLKRVLFIPFIINMVITLSSPFTNYIFLISEENIYNRGTLFMVPIIIIFVYLICGFIVLVKNKRSINNEEFYPLIVSVLLPLAGLIIQGTFYGILLAWSSVAFSCIIVFIFLQQRMFQLDTLTGAWARGSFENYLNMRVKMKEAKKVGIIFLDLDDFKKLNDTFGHIEGDQALKTVVKIIKSVLKPSEFVARFGGDEFVIISELDSIKQLEKLVMKIEKAFEDYNTITDKKYKLKYSCGYDVFKPKVHSIDKFLNHVDYLMYCKKSSKKSNIRNSIKYI
jgi:diguanylate cyclase (GGDEF)-like protein